MKKLLISFFLLFIASPIFSQIIVKGKVTDCDRKPPILAHAHIGKTGEDAKKITSRQCSANGSFEVMLPTAGNYTLRISAVNHEETSIPLTLDGKEKKVEINVQLKPNLYSKEFDKVIVIGDWNKFAFASTEVMTPKQNAEGKTIYTYERVATGDTLSYQLLGIAGGHSVNGTQSDYLVYDGGGDYRSVLHTKKGEKVTITFDPSKLPYTENANLPIVEIRENAFLKKTYQLTSSINNMREAATITPVGGSPTAMTKERHQGLLDYIKNAYEDAVKSGDTKFSQFAAVMFANEYDSDFNFGTENATMILKAVPASSSFWAMAPHAPQEMMQLVDKSLADSYMKEIEKNPEKTVRAVIFTYEMEKAHTAKDDKEVRRLYTLLKNDYADVPEIKYELMQYNPDAVVQVGKPIPEFELALLDGSGKVSNKSMLGKYYMIDFWATWCGPCVGEMPSMHKAYEKFKGKKEFQILSISMDAAESQIAPFHAKKWKMPWLNAFIPGIFDADIAKKFEVASIPKPILVGPDGKIVAIGGELRGEDLEKTLTKFLGESN